MSEIRDWRQTPSIAGLESIHPFNYLSIQYKDHAKFTCNSSGKRFISEQSEMFIQLRDDAHMTPMKIVQFSRLAPTCLSTFKILPPTWLWTSNFKRNPTPYSTNNNRSNKSKYNQRMSIIPNQVLLSGLLSSSVSVY